MPSFAVNPDTNRTIAVGGPVYKRLVKLGKIAPTTTPEDDNKRVYKLEPEQTETEIEEVKENLDQQLQEELTHAVRGRGKHKGHLVKRAKEPTPSQVVKATKTLGKKRQQGDHELTQLEKRIARELGLDEFGDGFESE